MDDLSPNGHSNGDDPSPEGGGVDLASDLRTDPATMLGGRDPSQIRDPLPQPLFSWRRLAIAGAFAVAIACLVVAARSGGDDGDVVATDEAVVEYFPRPGARVLRQTPIGVELKPGYDGRLTIDGVAIPEEQMVGAILPGTEAYEQLSPEQREAGPRPNNKYMVMFQPGEGKAIDEYATGSVDIKVRFWPIADGPDAARTVTYTINVT